jgi:enoyl-CoA hydratase
MVAIDVHADAVERELDPQVWSTRQPFFPERLAAFQARVSKRQS